MPNWCYNSVTIDGFRLDLKELVDKAGKNNPPDDNSLLRAFIPMPEEYTTIEGYNSGGYEWCLNNWGTKWAESSMQMEANVFGDTGQIIYQFDSPWNPPLTGYQKISEMFPRLTFIHYWDEPGMAFCGITVTIAGEEIMMEEVEGGKYPDFFIEEEDLYYEEMKALRDRFHSLANEAIRFPSNS